MGTSGSSGGPGGRTPLVPSWLDDGPSGLLPGAPGGAPPDGGEQGDGPQQPPARLPPIPNAPPPARFQSARRNFSGFAGSGGTDGRALRRAVGHYVRSGTGGTRNATRRMAVSTRAASGALGVFRGIQRDGVEATLRRLNLRDLVGRPVADIFLGLTDIVCPDGGSIDEGVARDAWIETVASLDELGVEQMTDLTPDQIQEVFLAFVAHSIEGRLFQDIGVNGIAIAADLAAIQAFETQLRSYIRRSVRDSFSGDLTNLPNFTDRQIRDVVDSTYQEAWQLLLTIGDAQP
ncbi:Qat anti-phage system associated protein QatB [Luteitalea sp.]|uniref:Qat anti-phage system associated protein QatB n=1 Tax=Luteitalea sp. TaxID=2004800 RepID=UPI0025BCB4FB|nr:Qat anti-phage system associated protein QatB [Luteitalea sp.]